MVDKVFALGSDIQISDERYLNLGRAVFEFGFEEYDC